MGKQRSDVDLGAGSGGGGTGTGCFWEKHSHNAKTDYLTVVVNTSSQTGNYFTRGARRGSRVPTHHKQKSAFVLSPFLHIRTIISIISIITIDILSNILITHLRISLSRITHSPH